MQATIALLFLVAETALGANILALMGVPSHSHHLFNSKYLEALAARGHHVTYVGLDKYNPPPNITHVLIENGYDDFEDFDFSQLSSMGPYSNIIQFSEWDEVIASTQSRSKGLAQLKDILKREKFDLIIHDIACCSFLLGAVDVAGRPPILGITAYGLAPLLFEILGNPLSHASRPNFYSYYSDEMTLFQRTNNYFLNLFSSVVAWYQVRSQNEYSKALFGNVRHVGDILNDINIIIANSNDAVDFPFPKVPGLVQIAGIQIVEPKPLPQDLQTYLDNAKHGVIYFSLGSNMKSSLLKTDVIRILKEAFKHLAPVKVLWKWETDSMPGKPDNVETRKWLPQNDILAHPNVRLFFTHSGGLGTQEAIYHGKPVVGLPFVLDQQVNARKTVIRGFGEQLDFDSLTVEKVVNTIKKVLNEPRYTEKARKLSAIYRDEMGTPMERAVYWTEYAIRHNGAPHLRFAGRNLYWYQNWMLDVILIISAGVTFLLFVTYKIIMMLTRRGRKVEKTKTKKS